MAIQNLILSSIFVKKTIMELSITQVPIWVSTLFIICFSTIPVYLIVNAIKLAYKNGNNKFSSTINEKVFLFYWSYFIIIALVSLTGFFEKMCFHLE